MLLLLVLVACVVAAYWGERRGRARSERELREVQRIDDLLKKGEEIRQFRLQTSSQLDPSDVLAITDREQVYIKALPPGVGARDERGWRWRIFLPPKQQWWLYVSQGEEWDATLGKYRDGDVSGNQIKVEGELELGGCLSYDFEGGRWIQNWAANGSQASRLSDAGIAALHAPGETMRMVTGELDQEPFPIHADPHGRIQLLRWHKVLDSDAAADAAKSIPGRDRPLKEYGFSIYLVEESPLPRPKVQTN